jgi:putative spermidine/putrescine transport system permease protein
MMMRVLGLTSLIGFAYLLAPILVILVSAFGATSYLAFPPQGFTLKWFGAALADPRYADAFLTSLMVACGTTLLSVGIGLPGAYALARYDFPGRRAVEAIVLMPLVLPALVLSIALTVLFSSIGFTAGSLRLIAAHLVICTPYVIRVTVPVLQRFDAALEEAAQNLGASPLATFFLVTLPAIKPGAIAAATLAFIVSFDEIDLAIFLASPRAPTLPVTIYSAIQLGIDPTVGAVSALLVLLAVGAMAAYQLVLWRRASA